MCPAGPGVQGRGEGLLYSPALPIEDEGEEDFFAGTVVVSHLKEDLGEAVASVERGAEDFYVAHASLFALDLGSVVAQHLLDVGAVGGGGLVARCHGADVVGIGPATRRL